MTLPEVAKKLYLEGYNCCESVIYSLKECGIMDVSEEVLYSLKGFRAGIASSGCICGVITAATIAIGLKYPKENKEVERRTKMFYDKFKEKFRSSCCKVLTVSWKNNFTSNERKNFCAGIIMQMITELEKLLK